jgi:hypothetical protein
MKKVIVFVGPTLPAAAVADLLPAAVVAGPAAQGDVYRATAREPWAMLIIDGVFDHQLSVWHKEILWALSKGVRVYGAGSMGALRAAELAPFGMIGVGRVFEAFAGGVLERDDEVAVAHQSKESAFRASSEALVNIRATLEQAAREGAVDRRTSEAILELGAATFYPDRTLARLIAGVRRRGADEAALARFEAWLGPGSRARIDQKRLDAEAALRRIDEDMRSGQALRPADFMFQYTEAWHEFRRMMAADRHRARQTEAAPEPRPRSRP